MAMTSLCWCENSQLQNLSTVFSPLKITSLCPQCMQGGLSKWVPSSFHLSHNAHQWPHVKHVNSCLEQCSHMDWATTKLGCEYHFGGACSQNHKKKLTQCLLLRLGHTNRLHVTQMPLLLGMICKLAVETVTFTTHVSV